MKRKRSTAVLFVIYCIIMLWLLFGQRMPSLSFENYFDMLKQRINLIPFRTVAEYVEMYKTSISSLTNHAIINIGGNVATFIPLGVFLPMFWDKLKNAGRMFICSSAIIVSVELIQYFTLLGSLDIDDYILNMLGIFIGFYGYRLINKTTK